jgi:hypothetical protein
MPVGLIVKVNNYGYVLTFTIENADGSIRDLTGLTTTLYVWTTEQVPTLLFSGNCVVDVTPTTGKTRYTVVSGNFPTIGTFNAEIELTIGIGPAFAFLEDTETFSINVIVRHPT